MIDRCLFNAPFAFMPDVQAEYRAVVPTVFHEVWHRAQVPSDERVTLWVVNPGQTFVVNDEVLERFPALDALVTPSTGTNHLDRAACARRGIAVYGLLDDREHLEAISASSEFTFLLLLNTLRRLDLGVQEVSTRRWRQQEDRLRGHELQGKTVGLVGYGRIGRRMARFCAAFEATVRYYDPYVKNAAIPSSSLETLFRESDIVCLCCVQTPETTRMIRKDLLRQLPKGACLINTSRGDIIDEEDLAAVLGERPDLRVGLDVLSGEALDTHLQSPLLEFHDRGQVVITPHMAGSTVESNKRAARIALGLLKQHLLVRRRGASAAQAGAASLQLGASS